MSVLGIQSLRTERVFRFALLYNGVQRGKLGALVIYIKGTNVDMFQTRRRNTNQRIDKRIYDSAQTFY